MQFNDRQTDGRADRVKVAFRNFAKHLKTIEFIIKLGIVLVSN